jgi:integrase
MSSISMSSGSIGDPARPRLLAQVHEAIRRRYYSRRTEEAYVHWIKRYIYFNGKRHPDKMGEVEVTAFLNHLALERKVAAATQNQALSALLFLYKEVLTCELPWLDAIQRVTRPARLPSVLTRSEVERLLGQLQGTTWLIASLLLWSWSPSDGSAAPASERCGLRVSAGPRARWQGREGPGDHASVSVSRAAPPPSGPGSHAACSRCEGRLWRRAFTLCVIAQISAHW